MPASPPSRVTIVAANIVSLRDNSVLSGPPSPGLATGRGSYADFAQNPLTKGRP
jgi:hypothetical protein